MLKTYFDPSLPHRYCRYGRMSTDRQNPRSVDQQYDTIDSTLERTGYPWVHVTDYRDDGKSGRYIRKRPAFLRMLADVRSGRLAIDLVLVDTLERFGRMEDLASLRRELETQHGVLVLTADSHFADPTSVAGQALGVVESIRATTEAHAKAHNVLRGKIDAAKKKQWPGGPAPFGYRLESVMKAGPGPAEVDHRILVPDLEAAEWVRRIFQMAHEQGLGSTRISRRLNADAAFVSRFGKFEHTRVNYILDNPIYVGTLRFQRVTTGVVNDRRVQQKNDTGDVLLVEQFCEPLVSKEVWEEVRRLREQRSQRMREARAARRRELGKQIAAVQPGLTLKYALTGFVRCDGCGAAMRPSRSGAKSRMAASYYYYTCPAYRAGKCQNAIYLPGNWLWRAIVAFVRERLFPLGAESSEPAPGWLRELRKLVQTECLQRIRSEQDRRPLLEKERRQLQAKLRGWTKSLGNPALPESVRSEIEQEFSATCDRQHEVDGALRSLDVQLREQCTVDDRKLVHCLSTLSDILNRSSPTVVHRLLAHHIDRIVVGNRGEVNVSTHRLGVFEGSTLEFGPDGRSDRNPVAASAPGDRTPSSRSAAEANSERPCGSELSRGRWCNDELFRLPQRACWSAEHAEEVARFKAETGLPLKQIGQHFGKSVPTIRRALRLAATDRSADESS